MDFRVRDATWLFEKHGTKSEQWWTSVFALVVAGLARRGSPTEFPLWKYHRDAEPQWFEPSKESFSFRGVDLSQIHVEAPLKDVFKDELPQIGARPDVIITDSRTRVATIIENKIQKAGIDNFEVYYGASATLREKNWDARTLLLISAGHSNDDLWQVVAQLDPQIILWEDVLRGLDKIDWLAGLFNEELSAYYLRREVKDY